MHIYIWKSHNKKYLFFRNREQEGKIGLGWELVLVIGEGYNERV
jgi:hypothetical protein